MIIVSALLVVGVVFSLLARFYTESQTRQQLIRDAAAISDTIEKETASGMDIAGAAAKLELRRKVYSLASSMESHFALVSRDMKLLYPKNEEGQQFQTQVLPKISDRLSKNKRLPVSMKISLNSQEYMLVILPSKGAISQGLKGWVVLYDPIGPVQRLIGSLIFVLFISLLFSAVIAVVAGTFTARGIAKPIISLRQRAEALSRREFDGRADIKTGDELEELGKALDHMAKELKEYDITQKRFFQNASHELKTPLMSIQGYAEGIKDGVFDNDREALDIIVEESNRLKGIVEELIYLSKLETREDSYKFTPTPMNALIEKSAASLKGLASKDNIRITATLYKDATLTMDPDKMMQALVNVMGNCIRYARSEVAVITSNDGRRYEIIVRDDGEGFGENEAAKVFDRFYKGKKGGSGLGLAITKTIVEQHKGSVSAANAQGGGAEFRIRLPIDV